MPALSITLLQQRRVQFLTMVRATLVQLVRVTVHLKPPAVYPSQQVLVEVPVLVVMPV